MMYHFRPLSLLLLISCQAFSPNPQSPRSQPALPGTSSSQEAPSVAVKAPPRTGFSQSLLNWALESPFWKHLLVPQARKKIVTTAQANGIPWLDCKAWMNQALASRPAIIDWEFLADSIPDYYRRAFHAYDEGNLCWDAAVEVEIASCSVGARNFPEFGCQGEDAFRGAFASALQEAGAKIPKGGSILDLGSGTGMSTRRLAQAFPEASKIQGIDLSPYFCHVGKVLLQLQPKSFMEGGTWVSTIQNDDRILYQVGDAANTGFPDGSFDAVNLQFVLHELPPEVGRRIVDEAWRVLKPNGQLWISEMDFEAPAYAEQRANALLFSLIRSTEPYLDEYAESIPSLFAHVNSKFDNAIILPATGRHFALVATKGLVTNWGEGILQDFRFNEDGTYRVEDTHLKVWESKQDKLTNA